MTGIANIIRTTVNGPYAYTWTNDDQSGEVNTVVTTQTLTQAYNAIGTLAGAMPGTVKSVKIIVVSV